MEYFVYGILKFSINSRMGTTRRPNAQSSQPKQNDNVGINRVNKSRVKLTGFAFLVIISLFFSFDAVLVQFLFS